MDLKGCFLKILPSLLKASNKKSKDTKPAKMSLVNLVKCLTNTDPWKHATKIAMANNQIPTHTLQAKKFNSRLTAFEYKLSSNSRIGPVTPKKQSQLLSRGQNVNKWPSSGQIITCNDQRHASNQ